MNLNSNDRTPKRSNPIPVHCLLRDCYFFEQIVDASEGRALCSHPEKERYLANASCPLYRFDWQRALAKLSQRSE